MPFLYNCSADVAVGYRLTRELTDIAYKRLTTSQISHIRIWIVDEDGAPINLRKDELVVSYLIIKINTSCTESISCSSMMIPASLKVMPKQEKKIFNALNGNKGCTIKVKKCAGFDKMLLTSGHLKKYQKAANGSVVTLPFTHKHLVANSHHKGGYLPLLAAVLGPILGGVAGGLLGKGIKIRKMQMKKRQKKKNGKGMYLNPWKY